MAAQLSVRTQVLADLTLGLVARVALAAIATGYRTDVLTVRDWAHALHEQPLHRFYALASSPDHLPGDLWLLKLLTEVWVRLGGSIDSTLFDRAVTVVPILADVAIALLLLAIGRQVADAETAARAARWWLLNPASLFVTAIWRQWDPVSIAALLVCVWCVLRGVRWWPLAAPFAAYAVLVKPQTALPLVVLGVLAVVRARREDVTAGRLLGSLAAVVALALATAYAVLGPFAVGLLSAPTGGWSLADRVSTAARLYPDTTVGAANLWMVPLGSLDRVRDDRPWLLGLTAGQVGVVLLVLLLVWVAVTWALRFRRAAWSEGAAWAMATATMGGFALLTRVHERYVLPVLALLLVLYAARAARPPGAALVWTLSLAATANLALVLFGGVGSLSFPPALLVVVSLVDLAVLAVLVALPWVSRPTAPAAPRPGRPAGRPSPA